MNVRKLLLGSAALFLVVTFIVPAQAVIVVQDDFDDDTGSLVGESATSGQVWEPLSVSWGTGDAQTHINLGQGGTVGAGSDAGGNLTAQLPLGTTISSGTVTLSVDFKKDPANNAAEPNVSIGTGTQGQADDEAALIWGKNNLTIGGNMWSGPDTVNIGIDSGNIRATMTLDLDTSNGYLSYQDLNDPNNSGSFGPFLDESPPGGGYNFTRIMTQMVSGPSTVGLDNLTLDADVASCPPDCNVDTTWNSGSGGRISRAGPSRSLCSMRQERFS